MTWEKGIRINQISEIITGAHVFMGVGAIKKIDFIVEQLKSKGVDSVIVMTGKAAYEKTGAWKYVKEALEKYDIAHVLYNKVQPNPETHQVDEAVALGRAAKANGVICIGGGSPIDVGKSAAVLLEYPEKNCEMLYEMKFIPEKAAPIVAINLTHGTGSEVNRFAVVTIPEKNYKPAIAYDCLYPQYSIDDPQLMVGLPKNQTTYVSVDAVNHVIEASTAITNNPLSITLAKETVCLVEKYLPLAQSQPDNLEARYFLTYGAMIAGTSFDNGLLHITHALEHPLSALKPELAHGLGLAVLLPAVIKNIYPGAPAILADVLSPLVSGLKGVTEEGDKAAAGVKKWLESVGINETLSSLGFTEKDIQPLVELVFETPGLEQLMNCAPVSWSRELIEDIYNASL